MRAAGFVLVGGRSTRMGHDKARLPAGSHLLLDEVAGAVLSVAQNVALIGPPDRYRDLAFECLPDLRPGCGPLAGIEAALASRRGELNLIVACDLAGLKAEWLRRLLQTAEKERRDCVIVRDADGRTHPLCAIYRDTCLPKVRAALDGQSLRLLDLVDALRSDYLDITEVIPNLNRPSDWAAWRNRHSPELIES